MTSLYNLISKCFVVSKHGIFITYPTNYDAIILQRLLSGDREERKMCVVNPSGILLRLNARGVY